MKFGLTANPRFPSAVEATKAVVAQLQPSHEVLLEPEIAKLLGHPGVPMAHMKVDVVLAIGGDGTILRALQLNEAPILGINSGSLGFLSEVTAEEAAASLDRVVKRDYRIEERLKLRTNVEGERLFDCVNEAVVHTAQVAKIRHFEIAVDDEVVARVRADGIIVATPTGSTSYSLSTGGPIVDPRMEALIVAAIAPFRPSYRPYVVPATSRVHVRLAKPRECVIVMDGQHEVHLKGTEDVVLTASDRRAKFIRFRNDFYRRVDEKLARP